MYKRIVLKLSGEALAGDKKGVTLILSHVNPQPMKVMKKSGFFESVGEENFCPNIDAALARGEEL